MTQMAASGIVMSAVVFWWTLHDDIPALYPTVDLFTAPFLAKIAVIVDETLNHDHLTLSHKSSTSSLSATATTAVDNTQDDYFWGTFTVLASLALVGSGTLILLSSMFKLVNLGAFLPSAVLSGFFTAVGVLTWTLGFQVDSGGHSIGSVIGSGDTTLMMHSLVHHLPSVLVASVMRYLGPKHPFGVVLCIFATVGLFYLWMLVFGVSMQDMVELGWFWSASDFTGGSSSGSSTGSTSTSTSMNTMVSKRQARQGG